MNKNETSDECPETILGTHFINDKCHRAENLKKSLTWICSEEKTIDETGNIIPHKSYLISYDEILGWLYREMVENVILGSHPVGNCPPIGKWENIQPDLHNRQGIRFLFPVSYK